MFGYILKESEEPQPLDTVLFHFIDSTVTIYDTIHDTIHADTIEMHDTLTIYIIVEEATATQTVVVENARAISGGNGVMLEGLVAGAEFAVYAIDGTLVARATALAAGDYLFANLPSGTYLLWHQGGWSKFTHKAR